MFNAAGAHTNGHAWSATSPACPTAPIPPFARQKKSPGGMPSGDIPYVPVGVQSSLVSSMYTPSVVHQRCGSALMSVRLAPFMVGLPKQGK